MSQCCATCIHFSPAEEGVVNEGFGSCDSQKFVAGYGFHPVGHDSVRVENDEGWAFYVGKDFGCIHHEAKP